MTIEWKLLLFSKVKHKRLGFSKTAIITKQYFFCLMKRTVKLSPAVAGMVALIYNNLQSVIEYSRAIARDNNTDANVMYDFIDISASAQIIIDRLDRRIPKQIWDKFNEQIKSNDPLKLENIQALYFRLTPEKQDIIETIMESLINGEDINVEAA